MITTISDFKMYESTKVEAENHGYDPGERGTDISEIFSHDTYWELFEMFSNYLISTLPNFTSNPAVEILRNGEDLIFNVFNNSKKTKVEDIMFTKTVNISSANNDENKIIDIVKKEFVEYWNSNKN